MPVREPQYLYSEPESNLTQPEDISFGESDSFQVPPRDIVAYNELRSCADLFRMYKDGSLEISPEFQREIVWNNSAQTRFIDSLVKQLPIPSMCFSFDFRTERRQVIDGLQRMWSIIQFLEGANWRLATLDDIDQSISGQRVSGFSEPTSDLHYIFKRIENQTLPITVIRCDFEKPSHMNYLFTIFHRLNRGAATLYNQEIRNCIYSGPFNDLLRKLDNEERWIDISRRSLISRRRYRGQELLLRFFAFHDRLEKYDGRLSDFLNEYMFDNRYPSTGFIDSKEELFQRTIDFVETILNEPMERRTRVSVLEALLVGISLNIEDLSGISLEKLRATYIKLMEYEAFSDENLSEGLSIKQRVLDRLSTAKEVFSNTQND